MVKRVLEHGHKDLDYEVKVPLERLQLAKKKKRNNQLVLGFIAGISLLVGGIGIMNIMLATVTERTREIGIRRALGARQRHIAVQFLVETVVLSTGGGMAGVVGCVGRAGVRGGCRWYRAAGGALSAWGGAAGDAAANRVMKEWSTGSVASILARWASIISTGETSFFWTSFERSPALM